MLNEMNSFPSVSSFSVIISFFLFKIEVKVVICVCHNRPIFVVAVSVASVSLCAWDHRTRLLHT